MYILSNNQDNTKTLKKNTITYKPVSVLHKQFQRNRRKTDAKMYATIELVHPIENNL